MKSRVRMLDMKVSRLTVDPFTNMPMILLKDEQGTEALPIWIGLTEACAIATELEKVALSRPMTHDLLKNIIGECGVKVDRVEVHDVRDDTFYATIHLIGPDDKAMTIDARPSDAIALALRTKARICVAKKVIDRVRSIDGVAPSGVALADGVPGALDLAGDDDQPTARELLEAMSDDEFGKWKM